MRSDLAAELFGTIGRFRRQLRRSAGRAFEAAGLTEAQAELLRLIGRHPDISVSEAAAELGLAANTASTLVSRLTTEDLVIRNVDPIDRRVGRLRLSDAAQQIADESRRARRAALSVALDDLSAEETAALTAGLAVLDKMVLRLREGDQR